MGQENDMKFVSVRDLMTEINNNNYIIPYIQRNYKWKAEEDGVGPSCEKFINDLINAFRDNRYYTIGMNLLYKKKNENGNDCRILDGQQRIITLSLIIKALKSIDYWINKNVKFKNVKNGNEEYKNFNFKFERDNGVNDQRYNYIHGENNDFNATIEKIVNIHGQNNGNSTSGCVDVERMECNYIRMILPLFNATIEIIVKQDGSWTVKKNHCPDFYKFLLDRVKILLNFTTEDESDEFISVNDHKTSFEFCDTSKANNLMAIEMTNEISEKSILEEYSRISYYLYKKDVKDLVLKKYNEFYKNSKDNSETSRTEMFRNRLNYLYWPCEDDFKCFFKNGYINDKDKQTNVERHYWYLRYCHKVLNDISDELETKDDSQTISNVGIFNAVDYLMEKRPGFYLFQFIQEKFIKFSNDIGKNNKETLKMDFIKLIQGEFSIYGEVIGELKSEEIDEYMAIRLETEKRGTENKEENTENSDGDELCVEDEDRFTLEEQEQLGDATNEIYHISQEYIEMFKETSKKCTELLNEGKKVGRRLGGGKRSFNDIITDNKVKNYVIPEVQRDYTYGSDKAKVDNLIENIKTKMDRKDDFYFSSILGHFDKISGQFMIYDGQQRIITLAVLISYALNISSLDENKKEEYRKHLRKIKFINRDFANEMLKCIIEGKLDVYEEYIVDHTSHSLYSLYEQVKKELPQNGKTENLINYLWGKFSFKFTDITETDDACQIFMDINSQGEPLTTDEIYKAYLIKVLKKYGEDKDKDIRYKNWMEVFDNAWLNTFKDEKKVIENIHRAFKWASIIVCYDDIIVDTQQSNKFNPKNIESFLNRISEDRDKTNGDRLSWIETIKDDKKIKRVLDIVKKLVDTSVLKKDEVPDIIPSSVMFVSEVSEGDKLFSNDNITEIIYPFNGSDKKKRFRTKEYYADIICRIIDLFFGNKNSGRPNKIIKVGSQYRFYMSKEQLQAFCVNCFRKDLDGYKVELGHQLFHLMRILKEHMDNLGFIEYDPLRNFTRYEPEYYKAYFSVIPFKKDASQNIYIDINREKAESDRRNEGYKDIIDFYYDNFLKKDSQNRIASHKISKYSGYNNIDDGYSSISEAYYFFKSTLLNEVENSITYLVGIYKSKCYPFDINANDAASRSSNCIKTIIKKGIYTFNAVNDEIKIEKGDNDIGKCIKDDQYYKEFESLFLDKQNIMKVNYDPKSKLQQKFNSMDSERQKYLKKYCVFSALIEVKFSPSRSNYPQIESKLKGEINQWKQKDFVSIVCDYIFYDPEYNPNNKEKNRPDKDCFRDMPIYSPFCEKGKIIGEILTDYIGKHQPRCYLLNKLWELYCGNCTGPNAGKDIYEKAKRKMDESKLKDVINFKQ